MIRIALSLLLLLFPIAARGQNQAELVVVNGRIHTADDRTPAAEAMAMAGGRLLVVGSNQEALRLRGPATRVVDLGGRTVIPGMIDAHAHLTELGLNLRRVDLRGTRSYAEVVERVRARAATLPPGTWVRGRGWDQNDWERTDFPTHEALSRAVPGHPVLLERVDGHAVLANARAMRLARITGATRDPAGGQILRGPGGAPTGVFIDNAQELLTRVLPEPTPAELRAAILEGVAEANRWGLTGVHDAGAGREVIELYEELARAGKLSLRTYAMVSDDSADIAHYLALGPRSGLHGGRVWVRSIKLYMDGALGSRGAALLEPYSDDPHNRGLLVSTPEHVRRVAAAALRHGFQLATHAIGDRGNRLVLDQYEAALREAPVPDHRFRVEHAQVVHPADIPRFAALRVIPSMQAVHQTSDMYWAGDRLGERRLEGAYAWRSLLDTGAAIPNGSDFPVERVNPLLSFHSAVTRQDEKNFPSGGWRPEQRMTREEALKSMTLWPAYAGFQEMELGTLTPGKLADFVVLDRDIMRVAAEEILATRVLATYLGGVAVYEAK